MLDLISQASPLDPFCKDLMQGFNIFFWHGVDEMSSALIFSEKNKSDDVLFDFFQILTTMMVRHWDKRFFYLKTHFPSIFLSKTPRKHLRHLDKSMYSLKNPEYHSKTQNQLVIKNISELRYVFPQFLGKKSIYAKLFSLNKIIWYKNWSF